MPLIQVCFHAVDRNVCTKSSLESSNHTYQLLSMKKNPPSCLAEGGGGRKPSPLFHLPISTITLFLRGFNECTPSNWTGLFVNKCLLGRKNDVLFILNFISLSSSSVQPILKTEYINKVSSKNIVNWITNRII